MKNNMFRNLVRRTGGEFLALAILVPLVIVLVIVLNRFPKTSATPNPTPVVVTTSPAVNASPTPTSPSSSSTPVISTSPVTEKVQLTIVTDTGITSSYQVPITAKTTVAEVLQSAQSQGLKIKTKDFGGSLGLFIEELNGVANAPAKQLYWNLYINGSRSSVGASTATVKPGDTVRWVLEKAHNQQ